MNTRKQNRTPNQANLFCRIPMELKKAIKYQITERNESLSTWIMRAIIEQLMREDIEKKLGFRKE